MKRILRALGIASRDDLLALHELHLLSSASLYTLWNGNGRELSTKALVDCFFGVVRIAQPSLFVEAGAKKAEASVRAREILPGARIVAFEASPENYAAYSKTRDFENQRIEYKHLALNDEVGSITFNIRKAIAGKPVGRNSGANSILLRQANDVEYESITVPCTTLDQEFGPSLSCALWVDVEGASRQVITGGQSLLSHAEAVLIEVEDYQAWAGQWTSGQVISNLFDLDLIPVARDFEYNGQYNILFIRKKLLSNREVRRNMEYFYSRLAKK